MKKPLLSADASPLFEEHFLKHEQLRVKTLTELVRVLQALPANAERSEFSRIFDRAKSVLEIDDIDLARRLMVSRPTIGRWARGDSAPHPLGRKPVLQSLAMLTEAKLKHHISRPGNIRKPDRKHDTITSRQIRTLV